MKRDPHIWIGSSPLGRGSRAVPLCQRDKPNPEEILDVVAQPLETSDIPVGEAFRVPEWCCRKCAKKAEELPKSEERMWAYAVTESRYQKGLVG